MASPRRSERSNRPARALPIRVATVRASGTEQHGDRRVSVRDHSVRYIARDDGACTDDRAASNGDVGKQRGVYADLRAFANERPGHGLRRRLGPGVQVVGNRHARREKDVVLELRVLRDVTVAVDLDPVADHAAVIDHRVRPDRNVVPRSHLFPDQNVVPGLQPLPERRTGVDHRAAPQPRARPHRHTRSSRAVGVVSDEHPFVDRGAQRHHGDVAVSGAGRHVRSRRRRPGRSAPR